MSKVQVFVGSGGVGKTTMAAAAGVLAAESGKKVLVLTIDPSRRLASTLGIEGTSVPTRVPGFKGAGELWASIVDHRQAFDDFVMSAGKSSPGVEKILQNRLYKQLSTTLAGSQDFSALEKLYSIWKDGHYDLVILDTPPAQHAIDFLEAPEKISALFSEGIAKWFREPGKSRGLLQKIVSSGTQQVLKVLERLTGSEFIGELSEFFRTMEGWQGRLQERTSAVHRLLVSPETTFCLVTGVDRAKLMEAENFAQEIRRGGYRLQTILINRAFPEWWAKAKTSTEPLDPRLKELDEQLNAYYLHREKVIDDFNARLKGEIRVLRLPELSERVYDLQGLSFASAVLEKGGWE